MFVGVSQKREKFRGLVLLAMSNKSVARARVREVNLPASQISSSKNAPSEK
mgnify:CR=1 FL=1